MLGEDLCCCCSGIYISNTKKEFLLAFYYLVGDGWDDGCLFKIISIYSRLLVFIPILALDLMALLYLMLYHDRGKEKIFPGAWATKVRHMWMIS